MGYLINYEVAHLNILYFYNFPCQSPGLRILENFVLTPPSLPSISLSYIVIWDPLPKKNQKIQSCNKLGKVFSKGIFQVVAASFYFGFFDHVSTVDTNPYEKA